MPLHPPPAGWHPRLYLWSTCGLSHVANVLSTPVFCPKCHLNPELCCYHGCHYPAGWPYTTAQEVGWYHCCCWPWYDCCCLVTKSCLTLCDPMDYSLSGSSIHGVFQARIVEWVAISFSRGSSQPRNRTPISCFADRFFTTWATWETQVPDNLS